MDAMLRDAKMDTVVIDMNVATVQSLAKSGRAAMYGDATQAAILEEAGIARATHLIVTLPGAEGLASLVLMARELNAGIEVIVRTRYLADGDGLRAAGATHVVFDEGETGVALARHVLERRGVEASLVNRVLEAIRKTWNMNASPSATSMQAGANTSEPTPGVTNGPAA